MDWRKNRVAIGGVVFVALLGLTFWAANRQDRAPSASGEVPTIEIDEDAITTLEITRPGGERVVLSKGDPDWTITEPLEAAADPNNIESALNRLGDLRITRIVASRPENYARLQVDGASAVHVVAKSGDETVADLMVGKYADGMTMLRLGDTTEVFGASGSLRYAFDRDLRIWRNRRIVNVEAADVSSIRFENSNGVFQFDRSAEGWNITEGKERLDGFDAKQVNGLLSTAARLTASSFADEDVSAARAGLTEPRGKVTLTMKDEAPAIVLEIGEATENPTEIYLRRSDEATIYIISSYLAGRLQPGAEAFAPSPEPPTTPPAMPAAPQGQAPPQLPPEVMRQLQEQIKAQQQQQR
jgi:hypothetical protein